MLIFVISLLCLIAGIIFCIFRSKWFARGCLILGVVLFCLSCFCVIPAGCTGVVTTLNNVHAEILETGMYWKVPWDNVILMNNRDQQIKFDVGILSADNHNAQITGTVELNIDKKSANLIYQEAGTNYIEVFVYPRLQTYVEAICSNYDVEELAAESDLLSAEILARMAGYFCNHGLNIISVSVNTVNLTEN